MTTENSLQSPRKADVPPPAVTFLGTADAFNAGGFANSSYWVHDTLGQFCVDFGPTALMKANEYGLKVNGWMHSSSRIFMATTSAVSRCSYCTLIMN